MEEGHLSQRVQSILLCREDYLLVTSGSEPGSFERQPAEHCWQQEGDGQKQGGLR